MLTASNIITQTDTHENVPYQHTQELIKKKLWNNACQTLILIIPEYEVIKNVGDIICIHIGPRSNLETTFD